ncbi:MAG TPA: hypothetical protein VN750_26025 [Steroidobacteraceae bacterium]|nr:hypothetical protein [Steroidobacteraceae bacterium]
MTDDNICYCGNYGGGKHTRSARCPGGEALSSNPPDVQQFAAAVDKFLDELVTHGLIPRHYRNTMRKAEELRLQAQSLQGECPTGDYKPAEAIEPQGSRSESPASSPPDETKEHRTDTRLAGDIEYCLAKINPATDVHAILTEVMKDLRTPAETSSRPFVVYRSCAKHIGIPWTLSATYTTTPKEVCPICDPPGGSAVKASGEVPHIMAAIARSEPTCANLLCDGKAVAGENYCHKCLNEEEVPEKAGGDCTCRPGTTWTDTNCPVHRPGC